MGRQKSHPHSASEATFKSSVAGKGTCGRRVKREVLTIKDTDMSLQWPILIVSLVELQRLMA